MGFFSDLKEDLSQAVSELKPEEVKAEPETAEPEYDMDADLADILDGLDEKYEAAKGEIKFDELDSFGAVETESASESEPEMVADEMPVTASVTVAPVTAAPINTAPVTINPAPTPVGRVAADEVSVIMPSMIINGNMATEGSLDIQGSIVGNVEALGKLNITGNIQGDSSAAEIFAEGAKITGEVKSMGAIKIGQSTTIIGNVFATSAVIAGAVKGDIDVKGPVILDATAIVLGNIKSKAVQINNGAVIEGMCSQCYAEVNPISFFEELKKMK